MAARHCLAPLHSRRTDASPLRLTDKEKYPEGKHANIRDFVAALLQADGSNKLRACVDVYCEGSDLEHWASTLAALSDFPDLDYRFVAGAHPHEAKNYTDELERRFLEAHRHERCVGWGEIGLDYHYDNSPRDVQQDVLRRQLRTALGSGENKAVRSCFHLSPLARLRLTADARRRSRFTHAKPTMTLCGSSRRNCLGSSASTSTGARPVVRAVVALPHAHIVAWPPVALSCTRSYTDSPECAASLLSHFPNLFIGITGVVTYSTNVNTPQVIRDLGATCSPSNPAGLRILLETDAPFMPPANMANKQLGMTSKQRFPFAHGGVLPWTAEFVKRVLNEGKGEDEDKWTTAGVLRQARENARLCYGV